MQKLSIPSYACKVAFMLLYFLLFNASSLRAQVSTSGEEVFLKVKTSGKLVTPNKLVFVVDVDVPDGWKLKVTDGYESMWVYGIDTVDMALKFRTNPNYQIIERLKADRKPGIHGYYYEDVTFVQTLRINSKNLPLFIDAELKLALARKDEKDFVRANPCCLLQVCQKRTAAKTLKVGWDCDRREKVYLEDVTD